MSGAPRVHGWPAGLGRVPPRRRLSRRRRILAARKAWARLILVRGAPNGRRWMRRRPFGSDRTRPHSGPVRLGFVAARAGRTVAVLASWRAASSSSADDGPCDRSHRSRSRALCRASRRPAIDRAHCRFGKCVSSRQAHLTRHYVLAVPGPSVTASRGQVPGDSRGAGNDMRTVRRPAGVTSDCEGCRPSQGPEAASAEDQQSAGQHFSRAERDRRGSPPLSARLPRRRTPPWPGVGEGSGRNTTRGQVSRAQDRSYRVHRRRWSFRYSP